MANLGIEGMDELEQYDDPELRELARMEAAGEDGIDMNEDNMMDELNNMAGTKPQGPPYKEYQALVEQEASEKAQTLAFKQAQNMQEAMAHMRLMKEAQAKMEDLRTRFPGIENGDQPAKEESKQED